MSFIKYLLYVSHFTYIFINAQESQEIDTIFTTLQVRKLMHRELNARTRIQFKTYAYSCLATALIIVRTA